MPIWDQSGCVVITCRKQASCNSQARNTFSERTDGTPYLSASPKQAEQPLHGNGPWSCSGVIVDQRQGIVLCHGSVFLPFLLNDIDLVCLEQKQLLLPENLSHDLVVNIQCATENKKKEYTKSNIHMDIGAGNPDLGVIALSNEGGLQRRAKQHEAQLLMMVPCKEFQNTFHKLFSKAESWSFSSEEDKLDHNELEKDLHFLHWFAVLKTTHKGDSGSAEMKFMQASSLHKGDVLFTCGSPFGFFYPDIFLNTLSKGVVSNVAGEGNAVILTDSRCLPGTEGGGAYTICEGSLVLVGIIVVPLCWKANEWIGLTVLCSVSQILENVKMVLPVLSRPLIDMWPRMMLKPKFSMESELSSNLIQHLTSAAVLVDCGHVWGSGVIVNTRTVLTCRHVVSGASRILVRRRYQTVGGFHAVRGKVVFATKEYSPFDIAVVELEKSFPGFIEPALGSAYTTGDDVGIIAFGAFGTQCGPSVTSGILSAVIEVNNVPVMLQSTCAVHSGSSGGPLFNTRTRELLGIVASNTRDNSVGATYPHLNFSVPITLMQPGLSQYYKSKDLRGFEELDWTSDSVRAAWRLQRKPKQINMSKL
ncbi:peroxisomal leader peptide-processing protease isoform X2 [Pleurodeles waltl]|uniref:peroxisomal leader peptide-processing protease isoform X2 n=1 Tax=Pleurodeles waltl TaxID=8319 RepID=UPI003709B20A